MALHTLALQHKAIDVAISKSGSRLAVLSDRGLALYALDLHKRPIPKPVLIWQSDAIKSHSPRHVAFVGDKEMFCLTDNWDEEESCLWRYAGEELVSLGPIVETEGVSSLSSGIDCDSLYIQLQNGAINLVNTTESSEGLPPQTLLVHRFPSFAPEFRVITHEEQVRFTTLIETSEMLTRPDTCLCLD